MNKLILLGALALAALVSCNKGGKDPRLVIITYDGLRWQEVYGGPEEALVDNPKYTPDAAALMAKYGGETPEARRAALLPFIWSYFKTMFKLLGIRIRGKV